MPSPSAPLRLALLPCLLGLAPVLKADEPAFGFQVGSALPSGDLKDVFDAGAAFSIGGHALVDLGGGHALRPRLDFQFFRGNLFKDPQIVANMAENAGVPIGVIGPITRNDFRATQATLGADYNFHFGGSAKEGPYVLAGLGITRISRSGGLSSSIGGVNYNIDLYRASVQMMLKGGFGYQFTPNLGMEIAYQTVRIPDLFTEATVSVQGRGSISAKIPQLDDLDLNTTVLGVTWRF